MSATADNSPPAVAAVDQLDEHARRVHQRRWYTLGVLCLSLLIVTVGNSSLNVAIPTLSRDLNATTQQLQWVIAIYSLVFAGLLFSTGAIGDRFGRKGALQLGLVIFMVACGFAAMSTAMWEIIAARAVMGVGAALIMPSTLSILVNVFPPAERAKAIAIWAATTGAAGAVGPVASGWLLGHFWYGAVFLVNVPIIAFALISGYFLVPKSKDPQQGKLDPLGAVLSTVGIVALVYGLIEGPDNGWGSGVTLISFAVAAVVLVAFVLWENHVEEPMLDMAFFKNRAFSTGSAGMILVFMAMYGVMFLISQYFQLVLNYTPLSSALRLLPMAPIMIIVAPQTPRLTARFGANKTVAFGMTLLVLGLLMFRAVGLDTQYWYILLCLFPLVSGIAMSMSPMTASIMSAVPPRRAGAGSAMNDATREMGAALGVAVLGSVAASAYSSSINAITTTLPPAAQEEAAVSLSGALHVASTLPGEAGNALAHGAQLAFVDGVHLAVTIGAVLTAIAAVLVWRFLPKTIAGGEAGAHGGNEVLDAVEITAELGLGGTMPIYEDEVEAMEAAQADQPADGSPVALGSSDAAQVVAEAEATLEDAAQRESSAGDELMGDSEPVPAE
jgi:EmrB/QacA subfamily drug resistance transporter